MFVTLLDFAISSVRPALIGRTQLDEKIQSVFTLLQFHLLRKKRYKTLLFCSCWLKIFHQYSLVARDAERERVAN